VRPGIHDGNWEGWTCASAYQGVSPESLRSQPSLPTTRKEITPNAKINRISGKASFAIGLVDGKTAAGTNFIGVDATAWGFSRPILSG
jgi:hypothetical protein